MLLAEGVAQGDRHQRPARAAAQGRSAARGRRCATATNSCAVQEELAAIPGVTVLIHDQECAAEKRRKRSGASSRRRARRCVINERVCEGCGDCGTKSNCLSVQPVETEFGRKTAIHQSSCNLDYSLPRRRLPVLPHRHARPAPKSHRAVAALAADAIAEPAFRVDPDDFTVRITGIGGTGVVTVAQILATAAVLAGRQVRTLDQTGLAQKGGAVVSDVKVSAAPIAARCQDRRRRVRPLPRPATPWSAPTRPTWRRRDPGRTTAVVSTTEVPTGAMVTDTSIAYPSAGRGALGHRRRGARARSRWTRAAWPSGCSATTSPRTSCCSARRTRPARCRCPPT